MESDNHTHIIILAGGKGTRMKCETPKCLTLLGDEPFLERVLRVARPICEKPTVVVGYKGEEVVAAVGDAAEYVWQREQLGTGHAVSCAKELLEKRGYKHIMILMGDQPLLSEETLRGLMEAHTKSGATITVSTTIVPSFEDAYTPFIRFGRIVRDGNGLIEKNIEYKDATDEERAIHEVGINTFMFDADFLWSHIDKLSKENAAGEYYLTDLLNMAFAEKKLVVPYVIPNSEEAFGVNSLEDLEIAKRFLK